MSDGIGGDETAAVHKHMLGTRDTPSTLQIRP